MTSSSDRPPCVRQLGRVADLGVDDAVGGQVLGALGGDALDGLGRLHHADGVAEALQVQLQALAVGALSGTSAQRVGVVGRQPAVAGLARQLDDRRAGAGRRRGGRAAGPWARRGSVSSGTMVAVERSARRADRGAGRDPAHAPEAGHAGRCTCTVVTGAPRRRVSCRGTGAARAGGARPTTEDRRPSRSRALARRGSAHARGRPSGRSRPAGDRRPDAPQRVRVRPPCAVAPGRSTADDRPLVHAVSPPASTAKHHRRRAPARCSGRGEASVLRDRARRRPEGVDQPEARPAIP